MAEMKNICGKIPMDLHEKVREEIELTESSTQKFLQQVIEEHFNRVEGKGEISMGAVRTVAVQVSEELFQRLKVVIGKKHMKQKDFLIQIIEEALEKVEVEWQSKEQPEESEQTTGELEQKKLNRKKELSRKGKVNQKRKPNRMEKVNRKRKTNQKGKVNRKRKLNQKERLIRKNPKQKNQQNGNQLIQNNEGRYERSCRLFLSAKRRLIAATIQFFDLFSGIGGFREGLRRAGNFVCVGHCEVDTYADKNYRLLFDTEGEWYCNDARTIEPERMPDFDLLCAGFPCQAFSIAGKREGFADARGTLFFEIARILEAKRPSYFILENVPGLLSHDKGRTFCTILSTLSELGYHVEWKVLNSKDFGVPQARKRVYIVGYLDFRCAGKILPEPETNGAALIQIRAGSQGKRVYSPKGLSCTLTSQAGGMGGKTGLYDVGVPIKENTKLGYKLAREGDSIDLGYANLNSRRGRVGHQIAHTLTTGVQQGTLHFVDLSPPPVVTEECRSLNTRQCGVHKYKGECSGVLAEDGARAVLTPAKENVRQNGRRMKEPEEPMFTITATDRHGILYHGRIRRLVPRECLRLQGYYDWQIDKIIDCTSDAQLYKQAGNGVTVTVIEAIGALLRKADAERKELELSEKG